MCKFYILLKNSIILRNSSPVEIVSRFKDKSDNFCKTGCLGSTRNVISEIDMLEKKIR